MKKRVAVVAALALALLLLLDAAALADLNLAGVRAIPNQKLSFRTAKVLACKKVEKSEKLLSFTLDLGSEQRTVLSGIAKAYPDPTVLVGKTLVLFANLAPRKIMGTESQGMLLSALDEQTGTLRLLTVDDAGSIAPGSEIG